MNRTRDISGSRIPIAPGENPHGRRCICRKWAGNVRLHQNHQEIVPSSLYGIFRKKQFCVFPAENSWNLFGDRI
jgi:hypothetical protein